MKNKKIFILLISVLGMVFLVCSPAKGQNSNSQSLEDKKAAIEERQAQKKEELSEKHRERLRERAKSAIEKRIESLNRLKSRVESMARLRDADEQNILDAINENVEALKNLRNQIENESDVEKLKIMIQSIFYDYRVFAVTIPQMRSFAIVGKGEYVTDKIKDEIIPRIEAAIEKAKENGKDTAKAEEYLDNIERYLAEMESNLASALKEFSQMEPAKDYQPARERLEAGKAYLKKARENLRLIREELVKIKNILR